MATPRGWRNGQTVNTSTYATDLSLTGVAANYTYNAYGELTGSSHRSLSWDYDLAGNRKFETDATGITNYTPDSLNQYASITGQRQEPGYDYDPDGNLKQDAIWTYSYDAENRLIQMTKSGQTLTFKYDYLGRRIQKTVTGTGAYDIKFLWNGWTMIGELAANGTTANKTFVWGQDFSDAQG
ncbi:MAG TPA: hypothetical protein VEA63_05740, partial [Opitutus sp.]|nr:hypothetical protein [Opitutus sp.]